MGTPIEASAAILETIASEQPDLLEFQAQALLNSTMSFTIRQLATAFAVPPEKVSEVVGQACVHLDRLERYRRKWRHPAEVVETPNLAALIYACQARLSRVTPTRQRRIERILRRIENSYGLARARAWIDDFIGPLPTKRQEA